MKVQERVVILCVIFNLIFLSWALGGSPLWALFLSFAIVLVGFFVTLLNQGWRKLLKFPAFWLGAIFLIYILIQGLNPQWELVSGDQGRWLKKIPHIAALPTSIKSPLCEVNAFRVLILMTTSLMFVCTIWLGVKRKSDVFFVLWAFVVNGFFYVLIAIIQNLIQSKKLLGFVPWSGEVFFGSFFYRNHGAAYSYLILSVMMGLFLYYFAKQKNNNRRSSPCFLLGFMILMTTLGLGFSQSRGGILAGSVLWLVFLTILLVKGLKYYSVIKLATFALLAGCLLFLFHQEVVTFFGKRFDLEKTEISDQRRLMLMEATYEMFLDKPLLGWGAGSFRYYFPKYQIHYHLLNKTQYGVPAYYKYAHSDWLQFLVEYGIVGCFFLLSLIIYFCSLLIKYRKGSNLLTFMICAALSLIFIHSSFDFILQAPAIWITVAALLSLVVKLLKLRLFGMKT